MLAISFHSTKLILHVLVKSLTAVTSNDYSKNIIYTLAIKMNFFQVRPNSVARLWMGLEEGWQ